MFGASLDPDHDCPDHDGPNRGDTYHDGPDTEDTDHDCPDHEDSDYHPVGKAKKRTVWSEDEEKDLVRLFEMHDHWNSSLIREVCCILLKIGS